MLEGDFERHLMCIETIQIQTDVEDGDKFIFWGRSAESILDRRIVWDQTNLDGDFQNQCLKLLNDAILTPTDPDRKIANFIFTPSTDTNVTSLTIDTQFTGTSLYEAIKKVCDAQNVGFKILLNPDKQFEMTFYCGVNRSSDQTIVPYVVFSPRFDNLITSDYKYDGTNFKTITMVAGEGEGAERVKTSVALPDGAGSGLKRYELYTDARDLSSTTDDPDVPLSEDKYLSLLENRGGSKLEECLVTSEFTGKTETTTLFQYKRDFELGDIVTTENAYGINTKSRISEIVISVDSEGVYLYPTFVTLEGE
jgi:hypothetical protein